MNALRTRLTDIVSDAFAAAGYDRQFGKVDVSNRPDLSQFQCNGALPAAKQYKMNPRQIGQAVVDQLRDNVIFADLSLAGPGFININLSDTALRDHLMAMQQDKRCGCPLTAAPQKIVIDYGGPNIAKPLHVGHLRSAIIGESLKRLSRFLGHEVWGDIHMGDWGLQMGIIITELAMRQPELPYFDPAFSGPYPADAPFTAEDLESIYPAGSQRTREDAAAMDAARMATRELQDGRPGYRALWRHIVDVSLAELKRDYARLNVDFDLWLGESDVHDRIPPLIAALEQEGFAYESRGALVIDIGEADDKTEMPPLMLVKSDGAVLYGTTDLATIQMRVADFAPQLMLYVVDNRQSDHFRQVFRGAYKTGVAPAAMNMEHIGFGTMNGKDGKPFKTRAGGVMKLQDLIKMVTDKAQERLAEIEKAQDYEPAEKEAIAARVGVATLKFADMMNHRTTDYTFDLDRFSSFEGCTGPYLLYTMVRIRSIHQKATAQGMPGERLQAPSSDVERQLMLKMTELPDALQQAFDTRSPSYLSDFAYTLAVQFNRFYHEHHILTETDADQRESWLALTALTEKMQGIALDLLGIEAPERM